MLSTSGGESESPPAVRRDSYATVAHSSTESTQGAASNKALLASVVVGERYCSWIASIASHNSFGSVSKRNASRHSSTCFGDVVPVITPALYQRSRAQAIANSVGVIPHASATSPSNERSLRLISFWIQHGRGTPNLSAAMQNIVTPYAFSFDRPQFLMSPRSSRCLTFLT